jgi:hypothetical protein
MLYITISLLLRTMYGAAPGLRSICGDILSIEGLLGVAHSGRVFTCPFIKSCNRSFQRLAEFCEGVFDTHRRLGKDTPHYQPTSFKLSQALREHLLRDTRHTPLQDVEARPSLVVTQCVEDKQIPLPASDGGSFSSQETPTPTSEEAAGRRSPPAMLGDQSWVVGQCSLIYLGMILG